MCTALIGALVLFGRDPLDVLDDVELTTLALELASADDL